MHITKNMEWQATGKEKFTQQIIVYTNANYRLLQFHKLIKLTIRPTTTHSSPPSTITIPPLKFQIHPSNNQHSLSINSLSQHNKNNTKNKNPRAHIPLHYPHTTTHLLSSLQPLPKPLLTILNKIFSPPLHVILTSQNRFCSNKIRLLDYRLYAGIFAHSMCMMRCDDAFWICLL